MAYSPPRISAQQLSPRAMSPTLIGVDRIALVVFQLSLKNTLKVFSMTAPFIDAVASSAGATNSW